MPPPSLTLEMLQKRVDDGEIDLSSLRLAKVPIELVGRCVLQRGTKQIKEVNLSNNLLTALPQQFVSFFSELQSLNLSHNKIKALPEDFGNLSLLRRLDLSHNKIRKFPASFASLESLKWLNVTGNPLLKDLAEVIGQCHSDAQCSKAAKNAVQYIDFSTALSMESTAIADSSSAAPTNDSSSSSTCQDLSDRRREFEQLQNRRKYKRASTSLDKSHKHLKCATSRFSWNAAFLSFLVLLIALGVALWLTFDSMRENCQNSSTASETSELKDGPEEKRFCKEVTKMLFEGEPPDSWGQFAGDFCASFKNHWLTSVNNKILEKFQALEISCWPCCVLRWTKMLFLIAWETICALYKFLADYFSYVWMFCLLPLLDNVWWWN